jgi:predicted acyltransferase
VGAVVSTLPALCSQLPGVLAGRWLLSGYSRTEQTVWMLLAGLLCLWRPAAGAGEHILALCSVI